MAAMKRTAPVVTCQVCLHSPLGAIFQCQNGHFVCAACADKLAAKKVRACPSCRVLLPVKAKRVRSYLAEEVIRSACMTCSSCKVEMSREEHDGHQCLAERRISTRFGNREEHYEGLAGQERLSRTEYLAPHARAMQTFHFHEGEHVRTTFDPGHAEAGRVDHLREGRHVRTSFLTGHKKAKTILHYEAGQHLRTSHEAGHAKVGQVFHYEHGEHVRTTREMPLSLGQIDHYKLGQHTHTTFALGHALAGRVDHFLGVECTHFTYEQGHALAGTVSHFRDRDLLCKTFDKGHVHAGEIHHYAKFKYTHTTFALEHMSDGDSKRTRSTVAVGQAVVGQETGEEFDVD
jgi:hypothetical protein